MIMNLYHKNHSIDKLNILFTLVKKFYMMEWLVEVKTVVLMSALQYVEEKNIPEGYDKLNYIGC